MSDKNEEFVRKALDDLGKKDAENSQKALASAWMVHYKTYMEVGFSKQEAMDLLKIQVTEFWRSIMGRTKK